MKYQPTPLDQVLESNLTFEELSQEQRKVLTQHGWDALMYKAAIEMRAAAILESSIEVPADLEKNILAQFDTINQTPRISNKNILHLLYVGLGAILGALFVLYFYPKPEPPKTKITPPIVKIDTLWKKDTIYLTKTVYRFIPAPSIHQDTIFATKEYTMETSGTPQSLFNQPEVLQFLDMRNKIPQ